MAFDVVTQYIPGTKTITEWDDQTPWIGVPFGANKYHELGKTEPLPPHGRLMPIIPPAKPKEETTSDITPSPDAPSSPATVAFVNDDSSSMDIPVTDTKNQKPEDVIDKEYEVSKRILGTFTPINDEVLSGSN